MIIEYRDGTRVELQMGDIYGDPADTSVCWLLVDRLFVRSPFKTINATKNYLLSLSSIDDMDFYHIPEEFLADLED